MGSSDTYSQNSQYSDATDLSMNTEPAFKTIIGILDSASKGDYDKIRTINNIDMVEYISNDINAVGGGKRNFEIDLNYQK